MAEHSADVVIIGAGVAGLAAAGELSSHGKRVILVEARQRLGGRIHTLHDPAWPLPIERGAEFIHGKPPETAAILRAAGALSHDIADSHHLFLRGRLQQHPDFFPQVEKILALTSKPKTDISFEDCLQRFGSRFSTPHKNWARSYIEGFDAADTNLVSARWLHQVQKASDKIQGDRLARIHAGYDTLIDFLRAGIPSPHHEIFLSAPVSLIRWNRSGVDITATQSSAPLHLTARQALVTVPVSILQLSPGEPGHILFDPPLPPKKHAAIAGLRLGPVVKLVLRFKDPWWEKSFPDLHFAHAPGAPFPTWWTSLPFRTSILTGWAGGPAAAALSHLRASEILSRALKSLAQLIGVPRHTVQAQCVAAHVCNWQADPFSRGAYSFALVGGENAPAQLAAPLPPSLFFAGEAARDGLTSTVAAALASAHEAARQILKH